MIKKVIILALYINFVNIVIFSQGLFNQPYYVKKIDIELKLVTGSDLISFDSLFNSKYYEINNNVITDFLEKDIYLISRCITKKESNKNIIYLEIEIEEPNIFKGKKIVLIPEGYYIGVCYNVEKILSNDSLLSKGKIEQLLKSKIVYKIIKLNIK